MEKEKDCGAIWVKNTKSGDEFFSIKIGDNSYVAFENKYKQKDNQPDFRIYESKKSVVGQGKTELDETETHGTLEDEIDKTQLPF